MICIHAATTVPKHCRTSEQFSIRPTMPDQLPVCFSSIEGDITSKPIRTFSDCGPLAYHLFQLKSIDYCISVIQNFNFRQWQESDDIKEVPYYTIVGIFIDTKTQQPWINIDLEAKHVKQTHNAQYIIQNIMSPMGTGWQNIDHVDTFRSHMIKGKFGATMNAANFSKNFITVFDITEAIKDIE